MKMLLCLYLLPFSAHNVQAFDLHEIRMVYQHAPEDKRDALRLNQMMLRIDSATAAAVLICYKGANEMIQAKYTLNPVNKLEKFNKGKELIKMAISRDTLNLETRFIRYSIQSNLPAFLGYRDDLGRDKQFLLYQTSDNKDQELKQMIFNYLSALAGITREELKQLKN